MGERRWLRGIEYPTGLRIGVPAAGAYFTSIDAMVEWLTHATAYDFSRLFDVTMIDSPPVVRQPG